MGCWVYIGESNTMKRVDQKILMVATVAMAVALSGCGTIRPTPAPV